MGYHHTNRKIITTQDCCQLTRLIQNDRLDDYWLQQLKQILEHSDVISSDLIPDSVVTMDSLVSLKDLRRDESQLVKMSYSPSLQRSKKMLLIDVPILSPLGISLLGQQVGDVLMGRIQVEKMFYQPEAKRHFDE